VCDESTAHRVHILSIPVTSAIKIANTATAIAMATTSMSSLLAIARHIVMTIPVVDITIV
jgi:hypothetical protein